MSAIGEMEERMRCDSYQRGFADGKKKGRKEVMDEFGILYGEDAKRLNDYMNSDSES